MSQSCRRPHQHQRLADRSGTQSPETSRLKLLHDRSVEVGAAGRVRRQWRKGHAQSSLCVITSDTDDHSRKRHSRHHLSDFPGTRLSISLETTFGNTPGRNSARRHHIQVRGHCANSSQREQFPSRSAVTPLVAEICGKVPEAKRFTRATLMSVAAASSARMFNSKPPDNLKALLWRAQPGIFLRSKISRCPLSRNGVPHCQLLLKCRGTLIGTPRHQCERGHHCSRSTIAEHQRQCMFHKFSDRFFSNAANATI